MKFADFLNSQAFANLIALCTACAALYAGLVALLSYKTNSRFAADAHVHRLFSEYLNLRLQYHGKQRLIAHEIDVIDDMEPALGDKIAGYKLYILEEMSNWVIQQERRVFSYENAFRSYDDKLLRLDSLESWKQTIIVHASQNRYFSRHSILNYTTCYGIEFIEFLYVGMTLNCWRSLSIIERRSTKASRVREPKKKQSLSGNSKAVLLIPREPRGTAVDLARAAGRSRRKGFHRRLHGSPRGLKDTLRAVAEFSKKPLPGRGHHELKPPAGRARPRSLGVVLVDDEPFAVILFDMILCPQTSPSR